MQSFFISQAPSLFSILRSFSGIVFFTTLNVFRPDSKWFENTFSSTLKKSLLNTWFDVLGLAYFEFAKDLRFNNWQVLIFIPNPKIYVSNIFIWLNCKDVSYQATGGSTAKQKNHSQNMWYASSSTGSSIS